jgi:hypothetical protein
MIGFCRAVDHAPINCHVSNNGAEGWRGAMLCGMTSGPAEALANSRARRPAYWFPLALFGLIVAASVPLHAAGQGLAPSPTGWVAYAPLTQSVSSSTAYNSSLSVLVYRGSGPFEVPEGWYWAAALAGAFLLTALWYRRTGGDTGRTPLGWPYLATGLALTALITAVPPLVMPRADFLAWLWLDRQWGIGTFALLVIAVGLGMLAWHARSRPLAVIALAYTAAALAADWTALHAAPAVLLRHSGSPEQMLAFLARPPQPSSAAILLLALGLLVAAAVSFGWPARLRRHRRDG